MSLLKPGTLCVIVGGCPGNIGLVVEVIKHLGLYADRADAYHVRTASGRPFPELWASCARDRCRRGTTNDCVTDRYKLRPFVDIEGAHERALIADAILAPLVAEWLSLTNAGDAENREIEAML